MTKCANVSIVGRPNVGKSTLLNSILGEHLSIVTDKPQTTRKRVLGIWTDAEYQLIFTDTPGVLTPRYGMQRAMMGYVQEALADSDIICVMVDIVKATKRDTIIDPMIIQLLEPISGPDAKDPIPVVLVVNKMDALSFPQAAQGLIEEARETGLFTRSVAISAKEGREVDSLLDVLKDLAPEGEFIYDSEQLSTLPQRFFVAELVREAIFHHFHEEVPYATDVAIVEFKEHADKKWHITADITVERKTQKAILIGKQGSAIKQIGIEARQGIEKHLGQPIFLELFVKVRSDWRNDPNQLTNLGY